MHPIRETVFFFYHISKHLKVLENYDFRTRHVLNFLLGVWICCKIWTLVIHYLIRKLPFALVFCLKTTFG